MKGFENEIYRYLLLVSNLVAIIMLLVAFKWPRIGRLSFFFLFTWACWMNWTTVLEKPEVYLEYGDLTWSVAYKKIINGWFTEHIRLSVGVIATCQGIIAASMLLNGWIFKMGAIGGVVFFLALIPFGVGSGFPSTVIMAIAIIVILKKHADNFIWKPVTTHIA